MYKLTINNMLQIQSRTGGRFDNQDFYGFAKTIWGELIVVCDGMGGRNGGRSADISVNAVIDEMTKCVSGNPAHALKTAIEKANSLVWKESRAIPSFIGMGTTLVALIITPHKAVCCHAGDSRVYQLRNGVIMHRTFDHSEVFEMVYAGLITEEQARSSDKSNMITRALGIKPIVEIEITDNLSYQKGDRFLLCTDGIWGAVHENDLVKMGSLNSDVETVVNLFVEKIDSIGFENGGYHDNLTAAIIEMESDSGYQ
jgi:serine/threonine protein phosphatase PrpC